MTPYSSATLSFTSAAISVLACKVSQASQVHIHTQSGCQQSCTTRHNMRNMHSMTVNTQAWHALSNEKFTVKTSSRDNPGHDGTHNLQQITPVVTGVSLTPLARNCRVIGSLFFPPQRLKALTKYAFYRSPQILQMGKMWRALTSKT